MNAPTCELCAGTGGRVIHDDGRLRVVVVDEPDYPGFMRVIWNAHVREMTDLSPAERTHVMQAVFAVERAQREVMQAHKINVASLGNLVPHVHWHVIPRFEDDAHFPGPIWASRRRNIDEHRLVERRHLLQALEQAVKHTLSATG